VFRVVGRDALRRRAEPGRTSYWNDHRPADDVRRYFKQF